MWACKECGKVFEEDELDSETVDTSYEYWGSRYSSEETYYKCPHCHSYDVDEICSSEIEICENCGEDFVREYDDDCYCAECKKKLGVEL